LAGLALDLGFSHHSHLTSTFTRHFGVPPGQARRLLRQSGDLSPDYASAVEILRRP
jgi:AraC-like DNA-binding protein